MATPKTITATYIGTYDPSAANCPAYIVLERSFPGEPTRVFKSPYSGSPVVFQDLSAVSGKDYHYLAYAVNRDGVKGENTSDGYKPSFLHQTTTPSPFSYGQLSNAGIQPQISSTATGVLTGDGALDNIDTSFTASASASGTLVGTGSLAGGSAGAGGTGTRTLTATGILTNSSIKSQGAGSSTGVVVQPPTAPVRLQPSDNTPITMPVFTFTAVANATDYQVLLTSGATTTTSAWVTATSSGVPAGTGTGTITWGSDLALGNYTWTIRAQNTVGIGNQSAPMSFTVVVPATPTQIGPSTTISNAFATFTFSAVLGATDYQIIVSNGLSRTFTTSSWYTATSAGVPSGTGTGSILTDIPVPTGTHAWAIQARSTAGSSPLSGYKGYTTFLPTPVQVSAVGAVTSFSPTVSCTVTYTMSAILGATGYQVMDYDPATGVWTASPWYTPAQASAVSGVGNAVLTITNPSLALTPGQHAWYVRIQYGALIGLPSAVTWYNITTPVATQVSAFVLTPGTPTVTFNAVAGATDYQIGVYNGVTGSTTYSRWFTSTEAGVSGETGLGSITLESPITPLASGLYAWNIRARFGSTVGGASVFSWFWIP